MNSEQKKKKLTTLHPDWKLTDNERSISRRFTFKGFNAGLSLVNVCGCLAEKENHHPDISIGWGYCQVNYTTHSDGDISHLDFDSARKLDELAQLLGYAG